MRTPVCGNVLSEAFSEKVQLQEILEPSRCAARWPEQDRKPFRDQPTDQGENPKLDDGPKLAAGARGSSGIRPAKFVLARGNLANPIAAHEEQ
jgi:hypothetical protein